MEWRARGLCFCVSVQFRRRVRRVVELVLAQAGQVRDKTVSGIWGSVELSGPSCLADVACQGLCRSC